MEEISITKGDISNLAEIQKLNQLLFIKEQKEYDQKYDTNWPFSEAGIRYYTKELTSKDRVIFIARDNKGKAIGYLAASSKNPSGYINNMKVAELDNTLILDEYRSKGIGSRLVNELKKWAKEIDAQRITVLASYENKKGINFYKKQGFKEKSLELIIDL